ncbi:MAG: response regulator, partial [Bacteroidetes bacterium]|nr:response regulator [Bacteroidota bacterium]
MLPTAMIVDDNMEMRATLKSVVRDYATVVDECTDGSEVIQHYRASHPDFVLMDIAMKKIDSALDQVNSARATLGAVQSRFENAVANIQIGVENLSAS